MNIPQPITPHFLREQQTKIVSRATIFSENANFAADRDKLAELDELLKASLGDFELSQTQTRKKFTDSIEEESVSHEKVEPARKSGLSAIFD
jgi:hypothetical protein